MSGKKTPDNTLAGNRKAFHDFEIIETFEAGLALQGTEVKSIKEKNASLKQSYIKMLKGELWLIGAHVPPYSHGNIHNHPETRDRKLLMHKYEITRLKSQIQEKGMTLVPLALYLKKGKIKLKIGLAKGKKQADKRQTIKERDAKRAAERAVKQYK